MLPPAPAHVPCSLRPNPAPQEPFGLTLIEAAAHGVPIVATTHGGPVDIVHTLRNGILVDPTDEERVAEALLELLTNGSSWDRCSINGVANINAYSWSSHCIKCLDAVEVQKVRVCRCGGGVVHALTGWLMLPQVGSASSSAQVLTRCCRAPLTNTNQPSPPSLQLNWSKRSKQAQLRSNYSASLDDFTFNRLSGSFSDHRAASIDPSAALLSPRSTATLVGQSFTTDDINLGSSSMDLNPGLTLTVQQRQQRRRLAPHHSQRGRRHVAQVGRGRAAQQSAAWLRPRSRSQACMAVTPPAASTRPLARSAGPRQCLLTSRSSSAW